jgi:hypothetical protein
LVLSAHAQHLVAFESRPCARDHWTTKSRRPPGVAFFANRPQVFSIVSAVPIPKLLVLHREGDTVHFDGPAALLAATVGCIQNLSPQFTADLALCRDKLRLLVLSGLRYVHPLDDEPFFELSDSATEMTEVFCADALFLQLSSDLAARNALREAFHDLDNAKMNAPWLAGFLCHAPPPTQRSLADLWTTDSLLPHLVD